MDHSITIEEADYYLGSLGCPGYCKQCNEIEEYASVEPDARHYLCPNCETKNLYGFEEAILMGFITVEGNND